MDLISLEKYFKKHFSSMRSDLLHPYIGLKFKAFTDSVEFIHNNMCEAMVCNSQNEVFNFALSNLEITGLVMEFGVKSGKSINKLAVKDKFKRKTIYGFDSFEGLPEDWSGTRTVRGRLSNLGKLPKVNKNVSLIKGWFKDTLPIFLNEHQNNKIAFMHIDCDIYQSTKDIFDCLGEKINKGTIIIFDEFFNYPNWQNHEYKAFQEFISNSKKSFKYLCYAHTQVAIQII